MLSWQYFYQFIGLSGQAQGKHTVRAELIGDGSISADAEILSMTVESMLESGLKNFQISVGHSQFFYGLTKAAGCQESRRKT